MVAKNQDFHVIAGDDYQIMISAFNENGSALDLKGKTVSWKMNSNPVIVKSGLINGNVISIVLSGNDTVNKTGEFSHMCMVTDSKGKKSTITSGIVTIE